MCRRHQLSPKHLPPKKTDREIDISEKATSNERAAAAARKASMLLPKYGGKNATAAAAALMLLLVKCGEQRRALGSFCRCDRTR